MAKVYAVRSRDSGLRTPIAVLGLTATATIVGQVNLSWIPIPGISYYTVRRYGNVVGNLLPTSMFTDMGLPPSAIESYTVSAINMFGEGPPCPPVLITTLPNTGPPPSSYVPNKTVNTNVGIPLGAWTTQDGYAVTNYATPAAALATWRPGDNFRFYAVGSSTPSSRYTFPSQLVMKNINATAALPINIFQNPGDYIRFDTAFGLIPTPYGSAGPGGIWQATTDWSVGQGLIHFENSSYINVDFRDGSGGWGMEVANPANWSPGTYGTSGITANGTCFNFQNYQSLTIVSSNNCQLQGAWIHGANQYNAGYAGWDCFNWTFNQCWWDKHGTNYGYKAANGTIEAAGNMFMFFGKSSTFVNCKSTYCGHDTGPGIWGSNIDVVNCDFSGDWTFYNTGKGYGYGMNVYSGSLQQGLPTFPFPYPNNITCGPNRFINTRVSGAGPGDITFAPFMGFPSYNTIVRQCIFVNGQKGGALLEANLGNALGSSNILACGYTQFHHNSVSGTPSIYTATDGGVTAAAHPYTYAGDSFMNNAFDGNTDAGSPNPYLIRHYQTTAFCGNNPFPLVNKGGYVISNVLNGPAASGATDAFGNVFSTTISYGAYSGSATIKNCPWTDPGTIFPGYVYGNLLQPITWNNLSAINGTLQAALAGLTLSTSANPGCIGTAAPLAVATGASTGLTASVSNPRPFWAGNNAGSQPDRVAIIPAAGGPAVIAQLMPLTGVTYPSNAAPSGPGSLTFQTSVSVQPGDKFYWVLSDNVTPLQTLGRG